MSRTPLSLLERLRTVPRPIRWLGTGTLPIAILVIAAIIPNALASTHLQLLLLASVIVASLFFGLAAGLTGATIAFGFMLWQAVEREAVGNWALSLGSVFDAFLWFAVAKLIVALIAALQTTIARSVQAESRASDRARRTELLLVEQAHRIRNDLSSFIGMLRIQASADPKAADALDAAANRMLVLGRLHGRLSGGADPAAFVDSRLFLEELLADLRSSLVGMRPVTLTVVAEEHPLPLARAGDIGLVVNELITNALKHAFPDDRQGMIRVSFRRNGNLYELTVADSGIGYASDHPQQGNSGVGLGSRILQGLAAQLGGRLDVASGEVGGTVSQLRFPLPPAPAVQAPVADEARHPEVSKQRYGSDAERHRRS